MWVTLKDHNDFLEFQLILEDSSIKWETNDRVVTQYLTVQSIQSLNVINHRDVQRIKCPIHSSNAFASQTAIPRVNVPSTSWDFIVKLHSK